MTPTDLICATKSRATACFGDAINISMLTANALHGINDIQESAVPAPQGIESGPIVYFLMDGGEVVYVGQCAFGFTRIITHCIEGKKVFDRYAFIRCGLLDLDDLEARPASQQAGIED